MYVCGERGNPVNGPSVVFLLTIVSMVLFASALAFVLLRKVFPLYRGARFARWYWGANVLSIAGLIYGRGRWEGWAGAGVLTQFVVVWFMAQLLLLALLPLYYLLRRALLRGDVAQDASRRALVQRAALAVPAAALGIGVYGAFYASKDIRFLRYEVAVAKLDAALDGFTIAQLSDVHLGLFFSLDKLREILDRIVAQRPDALVVTGDLIDDVRQMGALTALLDAYVDRFPCGIYFTYGNHEYFRDIHLVERALAQSKLRVLRNGAALVMNVARPLYFLGVDFPWAKNGARQEAECARMLEMALQSVPAEATKVLLSHHPMLIDNGYAAGIDLTLTGHTHGGQVALFGEALLPVRYKYMRGMYRQAGFYGYVNAGAGSWFPFRLGCPAEAAFFVLRRA